MTKIIVFSICIGLALMDALIGLVTRQIIIGIAAIFVTCFNSLVTYSSIKEYRLKHNIHD